MEYPYREKEEEEEEESVQGIAQKQRINWSRVEEGILKLKRSARERGRVSFYSSSTRVERLVGNNSNDSAGVHNHDSHRGDITIVKRIGVTNRK